MNASLRAALGIGLLTAMDAGMKAAMQTTPLLQSIFMRFACGAVIALGLVLMVRPPLPTKASIRGNLLRVPVIVMTTICFFYSVHALPLAEALALSFLAPVFIALLGGLVLGEALDWRIGAALAFGFAGMIIITSPRWSGELSGSPLGVAAALMAAVFYAVSMILLRRLATREHPAIIVLFQNAGPGLVLAAPALLLWQPLSLNQCLVFMLCGVLGVSGHLVLTSAFARAEAARLAPMEYSGLIWAGLLGYVFFSEIPPLIVWPGVALIVLGSTIVSRSRRLQPGPDSPKATTDP